MKLHSIQDRRGERPAKAASDAEDLFRLLDEHNVRGGIADEIAAAPFGLPHLVLEAAQRKLIDESLARMRSLRVDGGASAQNISATDFELVTSQFVDDLRSRLGG